MEFTNYIIQDGNQQTWTRRVCLGLLAWHASLLAQGAGDGSGLSGGDRKIKLIISFYVKYDG